MKHPGFSTLELVVVVAITIVIAAIAIPGLYRSTRTRDFETSVATMRSTIEQAIARARGGDYQSFSTETAIPAAPRSITINPKFCEPPPGTEPAGAVVFEGGTGNPFVEGAPRGFSVVVADTDGQNIGDRAAIVVTSVGTVTRWDWDGQTWRVQK